MSARMTAFVGLAMLLAVSAVLNGCAGLVEGRTTRQASSVVDFLYPDRSHVVETPSVPVLTLPLDVGIGFVPAGSRRIGNQDLDAKQRMQLMERIAADFRKQDFIRNIELIPTEYLRPGGSFDNLDQVRALYGVDVIVLLAYDQVQYTDQGLLSLSYWTIVGAYVFKGEKNDTSTLIDATVYDIPSRKLLFRAPGTSQVRGRATFVNQSEELRADSQRGFKMAADDLVNNLQSELARFKQELKEKPETAKVVGSPGYTGGGDFGGGFSLLLLTLLGVASRRARSRERASPLNVGGPDDPGATS